MRLSKLLCSASALVAIIAAPAMAQTTGTIGVTLNVTNACVVNGASSLQANAGNLGTIRFPDQPGIFGNIDGELVGAGQAGSLSVLCSPGAAPVLTVGAGQNDAAGRHRLASNGNTVPYRLFTDAGRTAEIAIGQQIALPVASAAATVVPIYARVTSNGSVLPAGAYGDTVQVTLSW
jgi:spore coat protein U-like protein